jgi:Fur family peroxide stress response transcriptional regulator
VYRNINVFREEGTVVSVGVVNGEEHFDGLTAPHPHLLCTGCGAVVDLPCPDDAALEALGTVSDFAIDYRKTVFKGLCPGCAKEARL